jgi:hypothetical protein
MLTYRVSVVASYPAGTEMAEMLQQLARNAVESSGVITFVGHVGSAPTLIASYEDVEGRNEDQARLLGAAIFKLESSQWPLPKPEALLSTSPSDPFVTGRVAA